ncbi:MAG TPA: hypothetical protein VEA59_05310 [Patescibacteria group bacterium]|nr:hypothetical protein [Patescibacteria group bacterium]
MHGLEMLDGEPSDFGLDSLADFNDEALMEHYQTCDCCRYLMETASDGIVMQRDGSFF